MNFLVDAKFDAFMAKLADEEDMKRLEFIDTQPHYLACSGGPCDQGRKLCPSPEACRLPETDPMPRSWLVALLVIVLTFAAAAVWS